MGQDSAAKAPRIDPRLMREGKRTRGALKLSVVLGMVAGWLIIAQAVLLAHVVNGVIFAHQRLADVSGFLAGLAGLFVLRALLAWAAELAAFRASREIRAALRHDLLAHMFARGPVEMAGDASADLAATLTDGIEALEPYFSRYVPQMALCVAVPLAILALVVPLDWISGVILLVAGPLIPFFMVLVGYRAEAINQRQWQKLLRMSTQFLDMLQGLTTLKLFGRARDEVALIARLSDEYRRVTMEGLRVAFLTSAVLEFFATLAIALVAVQFGARLIHGHITFYPAFLVLLLAPEFFVPLRGLSLHYHARMTAIAAAKRIYELLDAPLPPRGAGVLAPVARVEIACEGVGFAYEGGPAVLDGLEVRFGATGMTAILGESGAGKTTLIKLLLGFMPPRAGRIMVNGQDLAGIAPESWWGWVAYVPQSPRLLHGAVADNLRLGAPDATDDALWAALKMARAEAFVRALPGGLACAVGEGGSSLSGGQVQRIALARAYLKNPRVLVLDEATNSLDGESEALVLDALAEMAASRAVIIVAHRLKVAERAARVLVLDQGRVAQDGTAAALKDEPGMYRTLCQAYGEMVA
ncbi:thiol reductant ABC exporter subunit CydD [Acidocella sp.]|uniref:thiol reductant ABC exporter subunit CydD n=1 Tax=Acidocella sp. TaxID=50710 RepID=UPI0026277A6D|nr:thiol reductant ABC exporter subunit CydD [Acidocella sp.]